MSRLEGTGVLMDLRHPADRQVELLEKILAVLVEIRDHAKAVEHERQQEQKRARLDRQLDPWPAGSGGAA